MPLACSMSSTFYKCNTGAARDSAGGILPVLILVAAVSFVLQAMYYPAPFRPDEHKAIEAFTNFFSGASPNPQIEALTRLYLFLIDLLITGILFSSKLIDRRTLSVALIWPMTVFLFSKIYWEFYVFPFALIRHDISTRAEIFTLAALGIFLLVTGEANFGVIIIFRMLLLAIKLGLKWSAIIGVMALGLILDTAMNSGSVQSLPIIGPVLQRFDYTRDLINPDYSLLETLGVFFVSAHFFSLHTGMWIIDATFSFIVLVYLISSRFTRNELRNNWLDFAAIASIIFFFASVTHAFQNARYYYFFIPALAQVISKRQYPVLALLGLLHIIIRAMALSDSDLVQ